MTETLRKCRDEVVFRSHASRSSDDIESAPPVRHLNNPDETGAAGGRAWFTPDSSPRVSFRGVEQTVARQVHTLEVAGSSPAPATSVSCFRVATRTWLPSTSSPSKCAHGRTTAAVLASTPGRPRDRLYGDAVCLAVDLVAELPALLVVIPFALAALLF